MVTVQEVRDLLVRCGLPGATVDSQLSRVWLDDTRALRLYPGDTLDGLERQLVQVRAAVTRRHDETAQILGVFSADEARALRVELDRLGGGPVQADPTGEIALARKERDAALALAEQRHAEVDRARREADDLRRQLHLAKTERRVA